MESVSAGIDLSSPSSSSPSLAATRLVLRAYLKRIGFSKDEIDAIFLCRDRSVDSNSGSGVGSREELTKLLVAHVTKIPFENLGQHMHPQLPLASSSSDTCSSNDNNDEIEAINPTLDLETCLHKIIFEERGGFCWELNLAFWWLLKSLGYMVRAGTAYVITPDGPKPGHLTLFVDNVKNETSSLLIDPGFGDHVRAVIPTSPNVVVKDALIGDQFKLQETSDYGPRWNCLLMRSRATPLGTALPDLVSSSAPPLPNKDEAQTNDNTADESFAPDYLCNTNDDLPWNCEEFQDGLATVLDKNEFNIFAQKRFTCICTANGHIVQGSNYVRFVTNGIETKRIPLEDEESYRSSLLQNFNIKL